MLSSYISTRALPRSLARYMAASAFSSMSPGVDEPSLRAIPMLADTTICSVSTSTGSARAAAMRSAIITASLRSLTSQSTANSSPPSRPTLSLSRSASSTRAAVVRSRRSPASWPSESLITLKRSRSMNSTATSPPARRVRASAMPTRSRKRMRLGRPVTGS